MKRSQSSRDDAGQGRSAISSFSNRMRTCIRVAVPALLVAGSVVGMPVVQAQVGSGARQARPATVGRIVPTTIDEILDNPQFAVGQRVLVRGELGQAVGARAFTLEDSDPIFDERILVLGAQPLRRISGLREAIRLGNRDVQVLGIVRRLDVGALRALETELGEADLDGQVLSRFDGRPVILASALDVGNGFVTVTPGLFPDLDATLDPGTPALSPMPGGQMAPRQGVPRQSAPSAVGYVNTTIDAILDNPRAALGRRVIVTGGLNERFGTRAFTLEDSDLLFDDEILVLGATPLDRVPALRDALRLGQPQVQVRGIVRRFDLDNLGAVETELGGIRIEDQLFGGFDGQVVILASAINLGDGFLTLSPTLDFGVNAPTQGQGMGFDSGSGFGANGGADAGGQRGIPPGRGLGLGLREAPGLGLFPQLGVGPGPR